MSHESRRLNPSYRRNGKLQSCEPCRKGKLKCDHMMPTCGRCARRNKAEQCVYHPAPLTKAPPTHSLSETARSPFPAIYNDVNSVVTHDTYCNTAEVYPVVQPRVARASSLPAQPWGPSNNQNSSDVFRRSLPDQIVTGIPLGFQPKAGFTSHSAILAENESSLGITYMAPPAVPDSITAVSRMHIEKGVRILALLRDMPLYNRFIDMWFSLTRGVVVIEPVVKQWVTGIWSTHHKALETQKPALLSAMSEKVWLNTIQPLKFDGNTTPREFIAMSTGENLRWEVVGIVFSVIGLLAMTLQDGDPIFCSHDDPPLDRKALALKAWDASETCLAFCNDFDVLNDPFLWLLYEQSILSSSLHAKGSYTNWQKSGALYNAMLAFGLHQEIKADKDTPFFIAEFRKKAFIGAYANDKFMAAFVGRPPRLSRHYCLLQLPLDLNDSQIMSDGLDLDAAIADLDEEGWNRRGTIQRCTFARIWAQKGKIMEDILEISLGVLPQSDIVGRAEAIEQESIAMWENLPHYLRHEPKNTWDNRKAPVEMLFLIYIRLENLNHHFLLQRALIKKASTDSTKLLTVAKEMLALVLCVINNRDSMRDFQLDFSTILCLHGLQSAAVIAVELLHQEQNPGVIIEPLPRSDTIQDLSVFVGCLGSIHPENSGYSICERGRKFLKKILDKILSPAATTTNSNSSAADYGDPSFSTPLFQTGTDGDFMRWLETMEWEQESWTNFN